MASVRSHQPPEPISLQVSTQFDARSRSLTVTWHTPDDPSAFAHTRLFLAGRELPDRTYLTIVDAGDSSTMPVPPDVEPGTYRVDVETYSNGSWGGGRLTGTGSSPHFAID